MAESVTEEQEWTDAFYVTTYRDVQAMTDPGLKPRGSRRHGPLASYGDADTYGKQINCTHFSIDKVRVKAGIHLPFLNQAGVVEARMAPEYPDGWV